MSESRLPLVPGMSPECVRALEQLLSALPEDLENVMFDAATLLHEAEPADAVIALVLLLGTLRVPVAAMLSEYLVMAGERTRAGRGVSEEDIQQLWSSWDGRGLLRREVVAMTGREKLQA